MLALLRAISFLGVSLLAVAAQADVKPGDLLVVDQTYKCCPPRGALFVVDAKSGRRAVLSDFSNPAQGRLGGGGLSAVGVSTEGRIFVSDFLGAINGYAGALFEVDPRTRNRRWSATSARGMWDHKGRILVSLADFSTTNTTSSLVRVDPNTDTRVVLTDFADQSQGALPAGVAIFDLARSRTGRIFIAVNGDGGRGPAALAGLLEVQRNSGRRALISDLSNPKQAPLGDFFGIQGVAVE